MFKVAPEHLNRGGFLHGGFTATIVDMVTTYALMSQPCQPGVSVDLHVTYLKAAKEGDDILLLILLNGEKIGIYRMRFAEKLWDYYRKEMPNEIHRPITFT
ncbi:PREDICTED: acyl-coenzyme A thioesterase 13-like [Rhagoletis zephyria]|uniref:acyl-coenzyme A thioesterase 13-like n=1 Tax=Rhagoletis zephyria TaxID=28612 RepID=UPI00081176F0|nr:PREDICTED: acyl-coenzyme A thioesterase 13-like [Rhagoletis zephyria]